MQLIQHKNGVQALLTTGKLSIDPSDPDPTYRLIWDTDTNGGTIDPARVGGYSVEDESLVFSQSAFDDHTALVASVEAAEQQAKILALRAEAKAVLDTITQNGIVQRAFAVTILNLVNASNAALAQLKSAESLEAWQASSNIPAQQTPAQLITTIKNLIDSGQVDGE